MKDTRIVALFPTRNLEQFRIHFIKLFKILIVVVDSFPKKFNWIQIESSTQPL